MGRYQEYVDQVGTKVKYEDWEDYVDPFEMWMMYVNAFSVEEGARKVNSAVKHRKSVEFHGGEW